MCSVMSDFLWPYGLQTARLLCPWNSPGRNTGVGSHSLLQGIFLTQGLNPDLIHAGEFFAIWATREAQFYFLAELGLPVCVLFLVAESRSYCLLWCVGFSLWWLLLWSTGCRHMNSVLGLCKICCSTACGIFLDQGSNLCPLHQQSYS